MDELVIQISVHSRGVSARPTRFDRMTKAEANYRPAWQDAQNIEEQSDRTSRASTRARGRFDHMEIPEGAPSEEGPGIAVGTVYREECGSCSMFHASSCDIVAGIIDHEYVCDWWEDAEPS